MRSSACLTATSRPFASQSQAIEAGAWQMAQSGSILMMVLRALESLVVLEERIRQAEATIGSRQAVKGIEECQRKSSSRTRRLC